MLAGRPSPASEIRTRGRQHRTPWQWKVKRQRDSEKSKVRHSNATCTSRMETTQNRHWLARHHPVFVKLGRPFYTDAKQKLWHTAQMVKPSRFKMFSSKRGTHNPA